MTNVFTLLEREWEVLAVNRSANRRLRDVRRIAGDAPSLGAVATYVRHASPPDADRVLLALVRPATDGDVLAARVLLQLLLPGTRNLARRWWALGDYDERSAAAVAAVHRRIRTYPLERRPGKVAANVLMDASRELRMSLPRTEIHLFADIPGIDDHEGHRWGHNAEGEPGAELVDVLCDAVREGTVTAIDASLIARSRIVGHRLGDLSVERGVPERTLFAHRQRAEAVLTRTYAASH